MKTERSGLRRSDSPSPIGWQRAPEASKDHHIACRQELHRDFEHALAETKLPERHDDEVANRFLLKARREAAFA